MKPINRLHERYRVLEQLQRNHHYSGQSWTNLLTKMSHQVKVMRAMKLLMMTMMTRYLTGSGSWISTALNKLLRSLMLVTIMRLDICLSLILSFITASGLSTSHVFKYGEHNFPDSINKAPHRGVPSRINSQLQWEGGGWGINSFTTINI